MPEELSSDFKVIFLGNQAYSVTGIIKKMKTESPNCLVLTGHFPFHSYNLYFIHCYSSEEIENERLSEFWKCHKSS